MEYCPGEESNRLLGYTVEDGTEQVDYIMQYTARLDEIKVWVIFHCIVLGILVMKYGTEDLMRPFYHF